MTGLSPLTNCRCFALIPLSYTRKTTKLAGTNDIATIINIAIRTSDPWRLETNKINKYDSLITANEVHRCQYFYAALLNCTANYNSSILGVRKLKTSTVRFSYES